MAHNTNRQGANFELKVMHDLEAHGYTCLRSSGSRGKVDVVAIGVRQIEVMQGTWQTEPSLFIQCKITDPLISPAERLAIQDLALRAGALPLVAHWGDDETRLRGKRVHYRQLTGPGPKDWAPWAPGEDN